jgi:hypothetical protein
VDQILDIIFKVIGVFALMLAASDMLGWSMGGEYSNSTSGFITTLTDSVVNLPINMVVAIINAVLQIIGFCLTAVFSLVGLNIDATMGQVNWD